MKLKSAQCSVLTTHNIYKYLPEAHTRHVVLSSILIEVKYKPILRS
jgi:hypothetical protein